MCEDLNIRLSAYVQITVSKHREYIPAFIISKVQGFISNADIHKQKKIFFVRYCTIMQHSETVPTRRTSEAFLAKFAFLCLCVQNISTKTRVCLWQTNIIRKYTDDLEILVVILE